MPYTDREKLHCIERELKYRNRIYPHRVENGKMTQKQANRELNVMEDIAADYVARVRDGAPELPLTGQDAVDAKWDHDRDVRKHGE